MEVLIKDSLTLDDGNVYIVVSKVEYKGNTYLYLVSEKGKIIFGLLNNETIKEVKDSDLIRKLMGLFLKNSQENN